MAAGKYQLSAYVPVLARHRGQVVRDLPHGCGGRALIRSRRLVRWVSISSRRCWRSKSGSRLTLLVPGMLVPMYPWMLPAASWPIVLVVLDGGSADKPPIRRRTVP